MAALTIEALSRQLVAGRALVSETGPIHAVMGNESCDMDSIVSSLVYAAVLCAEGMKNVVPILNTTPEDLPLRTEAVWLLKEVGVALDSLSYVPCTRLAEREGLRLTLVDHNRLNPKQEMLSHAVEEIIDHHEDEKLYMEQCKRRVIQKVGSAASLVAVRALHGEVPSDLPDAPSLPHEVDTGVAKLLLGTVLIDTMNMDPAVKKGTPTDAWAIKALAPLAFPGEDHEKAVKGLFDALVREKFATASLTIPMSLRKDYKEFTMGSLKVGMSSILELLPSLSEKGDLNAELQAYKDANGLDLLILMLAEQGEAGGFKRELLVYPEHAELHKELTEGRIAQEVGYTATSTASPPSIHYIQRDPAVSRKVLTPKLMEFFKAA